MSSFPSVRIEGGLLGPDVLDQLLAGDLPGQKPADFGLEPRRSLTDEIAGIYSDARSQWSIFQHRLQKLKADDLATTVTRDSWLVPFLGMLGYEPTSNARAFDVDGQTFAISHRAGAAEGSPPLHLVGVRQDLGRVPASGRPRLAPHSLVQEYLNRTEHVWGIVTNGLTLRLLRDCTFVRRQAYIEFDLQAMLEEQRFQDFAVFYRLLHRTRLPRGMDDASACLLEQYHTHSVEQGGRVRDHLRDGVEECLRLLGDGFLRHPANEDLRHRASPACTDNSRIPADALYRQLLRLVYRFLFLLVSEDRGLLSPDPIYREHYSIARIRRLVDQRAAYTEHDDLWHSLRLLWVILTKDDAGPDGKTLSALLGLPVLNGELFAYQDLDPCAIANGDLLSAFWRLAWYQESPTASPRRVNYAALDVEELGSVYESLLEFHPAVGPDARGQLSFQLVAGSERKTTGSYYTPPELVGELIKSALVPVIEEKLKQSPARREKALLSIRVCDPACGSGHFLLAAARRIGKELARVRTGEDEPAPESQREAIRDVISHCVYGVDKNPLAVDLCRVALWLESHTSDKPLTFLDHRIRCGDALIGVFNLDVLKAGIPNEAFKTLEGDDSTIARALKLRNREELKKVRQLFDPDSGAPTSAGNDPMPELSRQSRAVDAVADDSPELIRQKKHLYTSSHRTPAWLKQKQACDLWTAAFFQPLVPEAPAITSGALLDHMSGVRQVLPQVMAAAESIASRQRAFHWPLGFPEVFADGGFDVVLSNPPWERVKLQEQEFFAVRDKDIANAANKAARTKLIKQLPETNPGLHHEFMTALRSASAGSAFMRHGGRFPLGGRGDINTYAVFAELASLAANPRGRAGLILPKGIATDDTTKFLFGSFVDTGRLSELVGYENEDFIFPAVDHRVTFCTLTLGGKGNPVARSRIAFYIRKYSQLAEENRFFTMEKGDFWLLNPNTGNCPIFRTQADAELTKAIYRRVPILWKEATETEPEVNPWRLSFQRLFDMANDSHLFKTADVLRAEGYRLKGNVFVGPQDRYLPLYEAKMLHQFDHRFSTYEGATESQLNVGILPQPTAEQKRDPSFAVQPRYWVREAEVEEVLPKYPEPLAEALGIGHRDSIKWVLALWCVGYQLNRSDGRGVEFMVENARRFGLEPRFARWLAETTELGFAAKLDRDFPITEEDVQTIVQRLDSPEDLARELIERFSPKWLMGWRDITNAGNERTVLSSALPRTAVGHTFALFTTEGIPTVKACLLLANLNSYVSDYSARQKIGGTHVTYNLLKQFPILSSAFWMESRRSLLQFDFFFPRVLELVYTASDLEPLALDCGYEGPPFVWDEGRRFEIRCELDAAFFHLYLPSEPGGEWRRAEKETPEQLAALMKHFPTPRAAVGFIMDQFPIVKQKDEQAHGRYRTKERIVEIYDALHTAKRTGVPYRGRLNTPPGER